MELTHIKYFVAVAEELHFGKAAERLKISQPPLSRQIMHLENELGVRLFERTKRKVQLTKSGEVFLRRAYLALSQINLACEEAKSTDRGEKGTLVIGFGGMADDLLTTILKIYQIKYPYVTIQLKQLPSKMQYNALEEGKIDVGLLVPINENKALQIETLREEALIAAIPKNHLLGQTSTTIELSDLMNEPFVMIPRKISPSLYDTIISICFRDGFSPNTIQEAEELQTLVALVGAGIGLSILPASIQNIKNDDVTYSKLNTDAKITAALAWNKNNSSQVLHSFLELIMKEVKPQLTDLYL